MPANPQDTTYGSDADLLEERGHMWKARAEKAEAELVGLRAEYDGAMEVDRTELGACAEKIATLERALADERETRAALEAQVLTLRSAAEFETERVAAAVLRERGECVATLIRLQHRSDPAEIVGLQNGIDAIRARSK